MSVRQLRIEYPDTYYCVFEGRVIPWTAAAVMMKIYFKIVSMILPVSGFVHATPVSFDFLPVIRVYMVAALSLGLGLVIAWTVKLLKFGVGFYLSFTM